MDELWQRFRTFWTPVLWGLGVFLAGLIVVHVVTPDPEVGRQRNEADVKRLKDRTAPTPRQISAADSNADLLEERSASLASLLDQRRGEGRDPEEKDLVRAAVTEALTAAILRGGSLDAFDGDATAAAEARARHDRAVEDSLALLRTQDPNVGYSRLQSEVVQELATRANRADVDVAAEEFGLSTVTSVDRAALPRRVLNLALIARVVDEAIRAPVRSIDRVDILLPEADRDEFLAMWEVEVALTGHPAALAKVLDSVTDPARPTALGTSNWKSVGRKSDLVQATMRLASVRVRPSAPTRFEVKE
jgi:hypothetical protein